MATTLLPRVEKLETTVDAHDKAITKHETALYGVDGCSGLSAEIDEMRKIQQILRDAYLEQRVWNRILGVIGSAFLLSALALIWSLLTHAVELAH